MSDSQCEEKLVDRQAIVHLAILIGIALVIGVYLIISTVLISKDGVGYIERAQLLQTDPIATIKMHPPGYPFLILMAHKCAGLFTDDTSVFTWIYSAQSVTLLCRLLAMIPLYFMGKLLVGSKNSFWGLLILIFLPFSAKAACEVLREWPYLLFLSTGFFLLLWAAKDKKWWAYGFVGLIAGLGYLIRPESGQLIIYGVLWGGVSLLKPKMWGLKRSKLIAALALLFLGFAVPVAPYMSNLDDVFPDQIKMVRKAISFNDLMSSEGLPKVENERSNLNTAEVFSGNVLNGLGEMFSASGENLMWFFVLPLAIGLHCLFRGNAKTEELFLMTSFLLASITMMLLRYCLIQGHVSQRWTLPLVVFTVFYIPIGLRTMGDWLNEKMTQSKQKNDTLKDKRLSWFVILLLVGIGICLPKLLRPVGIDKKGYREAAEWLHQNTAIDAVVVVPDKRIGYYAERKPIVMESPKKNLKWDYYVKLVEGDEEGGEVSYWVNQGRKKKKVVVYDGSDK